MEHQPISQHLLWCVFCLYGKHRPRGAHRAPGAAWRALWRRNVCALHTAAAQEPSAAAPKSQPVPVRKCSLSSLPISIQSSLNLAESKVLFILYVQDDLLSLLWMLKSLESSWIILAEPGLQCRVQSFLHTCALAGFCCAAASIAGVGSEALCAVSRLFKPLFIFQHLPFPPLLLYLIQFHPTFPPFLLLASNSCSYASLQWWNFLSNLFSATENFKKLSWY